jgi:hypothetical protein
MLLKTYLGGLTFVAAAYPFNLKECVDPRPVGASATNVGVPVYVELKPEFNVPVVEYV